MPKQAFNLPGVTGRPYSQAVRAGDFIFVSGTTGAVNSKGEKINGIKDQTKQCLENIIRVLEAMGASLDGAVKCTVFLTDVQLFAQMNEVFRTYFPKDPPARSTVIAGLVQPDMLVEIELIIYAPR
jgi:2-iminobutanoate/2-iminopropanoate deaminase